MEIGRITVPMCPKQVTVSLGVACWKTGETPGQFIGRADAMLYQAKRNGRNRLEVASNIQS
jgi:diguanylate cyclase (GGDEF)-like protein